MPLKKGEDDGWFFQFSDAEKDTQQTSHPSYFEACARYANAFDAAFSKAKQRSEFAFVSTLIRVPGIQDAGWDPYESSLQAID
jgi:hypothetical protein